MVTFSGNENTMVDPYYANTASAMACLYRNTGFSTFSLIFPSKPGRREVGLAIASSTKIGT